MLRGAHTLQRERPESFQSHPWPTESTMHLSRRNFVKAASVSGLGALSVPLIAARGSESLRESLFEPYGPPTGTPLFAANERAPYRIANPTALRLDSNENPNGPGKVVLD